MSTCQDVLPFHLSANERVDLTRSYVKARFPKLWGVTSHACNDLLSNLKPINLLLQETNVVASLFYLIRPVVKILSMCVLWDMVWKVQRNISLISDEIYHQVLNNSYAQQLINRVIRWISSSSDKIIWITEEAWVQIIYKDSQNLHYFTLIKILLQVTREELCRE
jgi:hypothetical protein